jgi:hypothetical protein
LEFIELYNLGSAPVSLYDPLYPQNTWRLRKGVEFDFPTGLVIPPGGTLVVVSFHPQNDVVSRAAFLETYGAGSTLVGPYSGRLDNAGEVVELLKPDAPQVQPGPDSGLVPYITVDWIEYSDRAPWPPSADGTGHSLQKLDPTLYGNDPLSWTAAAPRPGSVDADGDGLPDAWELDYGLNPDNAADAAVDSDGDGFTNGQEFRLGTDPRDRASLLAATLSTSIQGGLLLQFDARPGKAYIIEASNRPTAGWQTISRLQPAAAAGIISLPVSSTGAATFFRIRIGG